MRVSAAWASIFTRPERELEIEVVGPSKNSCTTPERWSFMASPLPL